MLKMSSLYNGGTIKVADVAEGNQSLEIRCLSCDALVRVVRKKQWARIPLNCACGNLAGWRVVTSDI
jgi:hypothetical protein